MTPTAGQRSSAGVTRPDYRHGPRALPGGGAVFRLWAPAQRAVKLLVAGRGAPRAMRALPGGWHELEARDAAPGDRYGFELADGSVVPDPASRFQPEDVHALSEWVDTARLRFAVPWSGRAWHEMVLYELHVGTFTPGGTFAAAIDKLDHLARVGVTGIEIMPVGDFPGRRNWGYDGVYPYAPDASYGRPQDFAALVDAAHERGIAVLLDVVYNHFGPDGNYLSKYAPQFFTERHRTPWGAGLNVDDAGARPVRDFFVDNALYWLHEYRLDGLRLDAVHAIADDSATHLVAEIADRVRADLGDRAVHLVLENEDNTARHLERAGGRPRRYTAQWNDDVHHVLHVALTGESAGYYEQYTGNTPLLARALAEGFAFQGEVMHCRGSARGEPCAHLPPAAFVSFLQNHDQVGNRAFGERLAALVPAEKLRAAAAVQLLAPQVPMLFMGEEWSARQPFQFFCDFAGDLAEAVRRGRREEFKRFPEFADPERRAHIPDPQSAATFDASRLEWRDLALPAHAHALRWHERILAMRRAHVVPLVRDITRAGAGRVIADGAVLVQWHAGTRRLTLCANLSGGAAEFPAVRGTCFWHEGAAPGESGAGGMTLAPWSVRWTISDASGDGTSE